ncbi:MAG: hypothetical protein LBV69_03115 [Bacteroidales bacterium]|jgi:hypothetical protein|nr:hypothetical protein [Bacteroidales bacterium]
MNENFDILTKKLDDFIKKYYFNKIIKGLLLAFSVYATWYLTIVIAEYFGRFSTTFRTILFVITVLLYVIIFIFMILIPILKLLKIGKTVNYKFVSKLIGKSFPEISDKLLNTIELKEMANSDSGNLEVLNASINQRTITFYPIPFLSAINLKKNIKYLKYLLPTLLIICFLMIFSPNMLTEATERIINFDKYYKTPAPFEFVILNDSLVGRKGQDFALEINTNGKIIPANVTIKYSGNDFFMEKLKNGHFRYIFKNLNNKVNFSFSTLNINSENYSIDVLAAPIIVDFKIVVVPPAYTGESVKTINNSGDITIPIGSNISWTFNTSNTENMSIVIDSTSHSINKIGKEFSFSKQIMKPSNYSLTFQNKNFNEKSGINYRINVIPDLFPSIGIKSMIDSAQLAIMYFNGYIDDDYGFSNLSFNVIPGENSDTLIKINIPFAKNTTYQEYYFAFDFASITVKGSKISYYFEVSDNDGINGAKKTKTQINEFSIPTAEDLKQLTEKNNKETESKIEEVHKISQQLRKDVETFKKKIINEKMNSWEKNQAMQQISNDKQQLENLLDDIKKTQNQTAQYKEQFSRNEDILKKQEEINKLFESLMDEEMIKMMQEMQKLMENFNPEDFMKLTEKIDFSTEQLEKEMDNTLEALKKAEVEENLQKASDDLKELAKEQQKLAEQTEKKELSKEQQLEKQKELENKFEKLKEELEKTLEKNDKLDNPIKMEDLKKDEDQISKNFQQSKQEIQEGKQSKSSKTQKKNSEQMEEMAKKIDQSMESSSMEQEEENMDDIRQIIENLLYFSFSQEDVLTQMKNLTNRDPKYKKLIVEQKNLQDEFKTILDSLNSLGSRVPMVGQLMGKDVFVIHDNLLTVMDDIYANKKRNIETDQQFIMTSSNNIILLLLEMLQQMQQQMANAQQKNGGQCKNCQNPSNQGGSKPGKAGDKPGKSGSKPGQMGEMRDKQQGLKRQMQEMLENMKQGQGQKQGQKIGKQSSEALAKMLMQQEMLKSMLNEVKNGTSSDIAKILQQVEQMMDQNISDLINGNVNQQTVNRQDQILTRLLQAENAEKERETDNKRKSNEAKDYKLSNPDAIFKEKNKETRFNELLQFSNLKLTPYYKNKYKDYLKNLQEF